MKFQVVVKKISHQAGVTLLEFIAFIGLVALVLAGSLAMYSSASAGASASDLAVTANGIVLSMRTTFPRGLGTAQYTPANLNAAGAPAGWGRWATEPGAAGPSLQRGARKFTVTANAGGGTFNLIIDAGDNGLCKRILASTPSVGGSPVGGTPCVSSAQLIYPNISLP